MNLINIFITSILTQNIVLNKFLGICPFMGTSNKEKNAIGMGLATTIVIVLSSIVTYSIYNFVLIPTKTEYLKTIMFILVIASMVQILQMLLKKYFNDLYKSLGIYLPLITTNCAVLGITLLNVSNDYNFINMLVFSLGSSIGFILVIYIFSNIREKIEISNVPKHLKGYPIAFITAAIMSLIFSRYI
ncbi:MAG TPA: RnfABCDGE type electron transport complex subunit A [Tenericutes bacterium]|nr:RnfABCDGE type electron transport complex subunit A [Mycoplasmatota bacterium]